MIVATEAMIAAAMKIQIHPDVPPSVEA